jgi:hypothetical protein
VRSDIPSFSDLVVLGCDDLTIKNNDAANWREARVRAFLSGDLQSAAHKVFIGYLRHGRFQYG